MKRILIVLFVLVGLALCQTSDPSPRFQLLGREKLDDDGQGAPGRAWVYADRATGQEVVCFSGVYRETLAC